VLALPGTLEPPVQLSARCRGGIASREGIRRGIAFNACRSCGASAQGTAAEIVAQNAKDGAWLRKLGRLAGGASVARTGEALGQAPVDAQRNLFGRRTDRRFSLPRETHNPDQKSQLSVCLQNTTQKAPYLFGDFSKSSRESFWA
jgi:hypothetical protein